MLINNNFDVYIHYYNMCMASIGLVDLFVLHFLCFAVSTCLNHGVIIMFYELRIHLEEQFKYHHK